MPVIVNPPAVRPDAARLWGSGLEPAARSGAAGYGGGFTTVEVPAFLKKRKF